MHSIEAAALRGNPLRRRLAGDGAWDLPDEPGSDIAEADKLRAFFGPNGAAFMAHYERRAERGGGVLLSWSWAALFSGQAWFFYRKMFVPGVALVVAPMLLALLVPGFDAGAILLQLLGALVARSCYVGHALATIRRLEAGGYSGEDEIAALSLAGGTSLAAGLLGVVILASGWTLVLVAAAPQ
jgi:hypothetical protein